MSSIGTNLLLLHGHVHDPALVRHLGNAPSMPPPGRPDGKRQKHGPATTLYAAIRLMRLTFFAQGAVRFFFEIIIGLQAQPDRRKHRKLQKVLELAAKRYKLIGANHEKDRFRTSDVRCIKGSGNVFVDLCFDQADQAD